MSEKEIMKYLKTGTWSARLMKERDAVDRSQGALARVTKVTMKPNKVTSKAKAVSRAVGETLMNGHSVATPEFLRPMAIKLSLVQKLGELRHLGQKIVNLKGITASVEINLVPYPGRQIKKTLDDKIAVVNDILQKLSPVLKSLEFRACAPNFVTDVIPIPEPSIYFPVLTKLIFDNRRDDNNNMVIHFHGLFYSRMPKLTELVVGWLGDPKKRTFVLSPLINPGDNLRNWSVAQNLSSLTVSQYMDAAYVKILNNFPQTWQKLDICTSVGQDLERLLEKNKDSLVKLSLEICSLPNQELIFPTLFPKLEKLELYLGDISELKLGCQLYYSENFPALKSLFIDVKKKSFFNPDVESFWNAFFPRQVFGVLGLLELNYLKLYWGHLKISDRGDEANFYATMFPNAKIKNL